MPEDQTSASAVDQARERIEGVDYRNLGVAVVLAFVPAIVLAFEIFLAVREPSAWMFWVPWAGFTYLLYRHRPFRNKGAAVLFYLAVEAFLLPVAVLVSTFVFVGQQESGLEQFSGAIAGGVFVAVAVVAGFAVGFVLWLISNRLEIEKVEPVDLDGK